MNLTYSHKLPFLIRLTDTNSIPYEDDENGLLGGYLYKEYINGTPNDRLIANTFLNAVSIPLEAEISKSRPASLKRKKKKGKN